MQLTLAQQKHVYNIPLEIQISQVHSNIRNHPSKIELRVHLSQLLMVFGQWQKALQQLQTIAQLDEKKIVITQTYCALIHAEIQRELTLSGQQEPLYFTKPNDWQILLAEALIARAHNQTAAAEKFQQHAYSEAPSSPVIINDEQANWIADGDSRLGPICEAYINGSYYWLPFDQIKQINIEKPQDLRDLVWIPATFTLMDSSQHFGFLPSRYAFSYMQHNDQFSLASLTEWKSLGEHSWAGVGQKMLITDNNEYPLLTIRTLTRLVSE